MAKQSKNTILFKRDQAIQKRYKLYKKDTSYIKKRYKLYKKDTSYNGQIKEECGKHPSFTCIEQVNYLTSWPIAL